MPSVSRARPGFGSRRYSRAMTSYGSGVPNQLYFEDYANTELALDFHDTSKVLTNGARQFTAASSQDFSKASHADFQAGDVDWVFCCYTLADTLAANRYMVGKGAATGANKDYEYAIGYSNTSSRFIAFVGNGTTSQSVLSNNLGAPSTGTWYLILVWYDSAGSTINIRVNNVPPDSASVSFAPYTNADAVAIGDLGSASLNWNGRVDNIIWAKPPTAIAALIDAIHSQLWNNGNGFSVDQLTATQLSDWGVKAAYTCDERSGNLIDSSGNSHDLTDNNTVTETSGVPHGFAVDSQNNNATPWQALDSSANLNHGTLKGSTAGSESEQWRNDGPVVFQDDVSGKHAVPSGNPTRQLIDDVPTALTSLTNSWFGNAVDFFELTLLDVPPAEFSVSCWVNVRDVSVGAISTIWIYGKTGDIVIMRISSGKVSVFDNINGANVTTTGTTSLAANTWYLVTLTSSVANGRRIYVNTTLDGTASQTAGLDEITASGSVHRIGSSIFPTTKPFNGRMSDFRLYNREITAAEVANLHTQTGPATPELLHYTFDETAIQTKSWKGDGVNDYIEIADFDDTALKSAYCWVKTTSNNEAFYTHYNSTGNQRSWYMGVDSGGKLQVYLSDDGTSNAGNFKNYLSTNTINDGTWHLCGFTFSAGVLDLSIDGVSEVTTNTSDGGITSLHNSTATPLVGATNAGTSLWFDGNVSDSFTSSDVIAAADVFDGTVTLTNLLMRHTLNDGGNHRGELKGSTAVDQQWTDTVPAATGHSWAWKGLNANSDYIELPVLSGHENNDFLVEVHFNPDDSAVNYTVCSFHWDERGANASGIAIRYMADETFRFNCITTAGSNQVNTVTTYAPGADIKVVASKTGTALSLTINSDSAVTGTASGSTMKYTEATRKSRIGAGSNNTTVIEEMNGVISDVKLYSDGTGTTEVGRWKLDEGPSGNTVTNGDSVNQVIDLKSNIAFANYGIGPRPTYVTNRIDGRAIVRADGSDDILSSVSQVDLSTLSNLYLLAVFAGADGGGGSSYMCSHGSDPVAVGAGGFVWDMRLTQLIPQIAGDTSGVVVDLVSTTDPNVDVNTFFVGEMWSNLTNDHQLAINGGAREDASVTALVGGLVSATHYLFAKGDLTLFTTMDIAYYVVIDEFPTVALRQRALNRIKTIFPSLTIAVAS